jgi:hypothetical protein
MMATKWLDDAGKVASKEEKEYIKKAPLARELRFNY